jgi:hypothetical protein
VLSLSEADPTAADLWKTTLNGGGMWAPGGVASDGSYVYAVTGNTFGGSATWGGGDALVRLGTGAAFAAGFAYFAPLNWPGLDAADLDMAAGPVVFDLPGSTPGKLAIVFGKDGNAYLLDRTNLGGVGAALGASSGFASLRVATNVIVTAPVVYTTPTATRVSFIGNGATCTQGSGSLTTLTIVPGAPPTLAYSWCGGSGSGSPMVTTSDGKNDAIVWLMGAEGNGQLQAFDGDSGAPITFIGATVNIPGMRHFNSPIAAKGRIFVAADNAVVAFKL